MQFLQTKISIVRCGCNETLPFYRSTISLKMFEGLLNQFVRVVLYSMENYREPREWLVVLDSLDI